jgi:AcrR family transcriptional regulator
MTTELRRRRRVAVLQRDPARTRQAVLEAAARLVAERGSKVSLDLVAHAAGVSKGGLLHHFPSREALLVGLVEAWLARFDLAVERHLDSSDDRPGRLTRAYIRANFDLDVADVNESLWRNPAILSVLMSTPAVLDRADEADRRWRAALDADGLHPQRTLLITGALDGVIYGQMLHSAERRYAGLKDILIELTESGGPIAGRARG